MAVSGSVALVPYDPAWPHRFEAERALLERVLAPWLESGIHHVGSTAIPGIAAKPVLDMIAGVRDFEEARAAFEPLREQSYVFTPHRPGIAHHFSKPSARLPETQYGLHLTEPESDLWRERLAFRDALRSDARLAAEYATLKAIAPSRTGGHCYWLRIGRSTIGSGCAPPRFLTMPLAGGLNHSKGFNGVLGPGQTLRRTRRVALPRWVPRLAPASGRACALRHSEGPLATWSTPHAGSSLRTTRRPAPTRAD